MADEPQGAPEPRASWAVTSHPDGDHQQHHGPEAEEPDDDVEILAGGGTFEHVAGTWPWFCSSVVAPQSLNRAGREARDNLTLEHQRQDDSRGNGNHDGARSHDGGVRRIWFGCAPAKLAMATVTGCVASGTGELAGDAGIHSAEEMKARMAVVKWPGRPAAVMTFAERLSCRAHPSTRAGFPRAPTASPGRRTSWV